MSVRSTEQQIAATRGQIHATTSALQDSLQNYSLNPEEAHRFRAILGEAVERLDLLGLVTADSSRRLATKREPAVQSNVRNRKDIVALMAKQKELERAYEQLMHKRWTLRGLSNKSKYLHNQQELKNLSELLCKSTADISQNLNDHPTIVGNLNKIQKDRQELENMLRETMSELQTYTFSTLVEMVEKRTAEQRRLVETKEKCDETAAALKTLEQQLKTESEGFEKENEERDQEIAVLTSKLKDLKKVTKLKLDFEKETALASAETRRRMWRRTLDDLQRKIDKTKDSISRDDFVYTKTMDFLNNQHHKLEELGDEWDDKYKTEYKELTDNYDEVKKERDEAEKHLLWHQERWNKEQRRQKELADEAARRAKQEAARKRLLKVMSLAQCTIRFYYNVHKRHKAKAAKGGKKKKGRKKKKKKG